MNPVFLISLIEAFLYLPGFYDVLLNARQKLLGHLKLWFSIGTKQYFKKFWLEIMRRNLG